MISKLEKQIAFRYLKTKKKDGFLNVISTFSFIGISLGVAVLIIVMSVMNGFRSELVSKIIGFNSHVVIQSQNEADERSLLETNYIKSISKNIIFSNSGEVVLINKNFTKGLSLRGYDVEDFKKLEIFKKTNDKLKSNLTFSKKKSLIAFKSRLAWHCHFIQKLYDEPEIEFRNMNSAYNGIRENDFNEDYHLAWKNGTTGYPFVDACMRYLRTNGWINFRMRAMLVSFASYQLWLDWKKTSKHLAKLFTDYEPGIHYSQFQMQSGTTGINSIRIYNPIKQSIDQDPKGDFIKKWVPELKEVPNKLVHEPWKLTYIDQKGLGIEIGKHYPNPIVDHHSSSKIARDKIWMIKKTEEAKFNAKKILEKHASAKGRR